jgi:rhodanese-related sulfurtransferase
MAANLLTRNGYTATNVTGGMNAWAAAGLPVITNGGEPGEII